MSHRGRQYPQVNRRWLSPGSVVPYFAPLKWTGEMRVGVPFFPGLIGVHGATMEAVADPIGFSITWTFPAALDPGATYVITQTIFTGSPRVQLKIRCDIHTGGFCEALYTRPTPFDYHVLHLLNGHEDSKTFAAPCDGFMDLDVSAVPYH